MLFWFRPGTPVRRAKDPLAAMRATLLAWVIVAVLAGAVVWPLLASTKADQSALITGLGLALIGVVVSFAMPAYLDNKRRRVLDRAAYAALTPAAIATIYRVRFFLRGAFANSALVAGFAGTRVSFTPQPYAIGLVAALVGLSLAAPTSSQLRSEQRLLDRRGSSVQLLSALRAPIPPAPTK
jgi:hypothetical protein